MIISGFPASYTPGQNYLLTISRLSGDVIENFNSSCRVGTGTTNAGTIAAGTNTSTYNVTGETNGIHLTTCGQASGTFNWTAPAAGTGTVRLYTGAFQGQIFDTGLYTTLVLVSNEALPLPGQAANPLPADNSVDQPVTATLSWTAGSGTTTHDVYFGQVNPPAFIGNQVGATYDPPGDLLNGTTYYWRIDERNAAGVTTGLLWQFATIAIAPPAPQHLVIKPVAPNVELYWDASTGATAYNIYRDVAPGFVPSPANLIATVNATTYVDPVAAPSPVARFYVVTAQ